MPTEYCQSQAEEILCYAEDVRTVYDPNCCRELSAKQIFLMEHCSGKGC